MIKAIIFDMDGLMIDTEKLAFEGFQYVLAKNGLTMSLNFYKKLLGKPMAGIAELIYKEYGEDFDIKNTIKEVHDYMDKIFENKGVPLKKGLFDLLKYLKEHDYKTIVATSSQRYRVDYIFKLAGLNLYFDDSICGDEVIRGKPEPEIFLKACQKLDVKPSETIVLEDSEAGINAAFNATIKVICIPDLKYPEPEFAKMTYKIMNNLLEVRDFLNQG